MLDTPVAFHELSFVPDADEVLVGRLDTGSYAALPADGAALLERMAGGDPPEQAARWYEHTYGEPVDIDEFLETLAELGFLRDAADEPAAGPSAGPTRFRRLGRALYSAPAWLLYAAVVACWLVLAWQHTDLLPSSSAFFFGHSLLVVQAVVTFGQVPLIFLHEGAHTLAGRRLGLPSRLGMSNRFFYIVFETRMNGLLSVPARQRYLPFLSGMVCDVVVLACAGLFAQLTRTDAGALSFAGQIAMTLAFTVLMRLAWQFQLYLRTDLYYVFSTALRCHDLHDASTALLRNRIRRLTGRTADLVDEEQWTERERRVGRWYGPFIVFGIGVMLAIAVFGSVPIVGQYVELVAAGLASGRLDAAFGDAALSLLFNVGQLALLGWLAWRKRHPVLPATDSPEE